jgi:hypothetical protein
MTNDTPYQQAVLTREPGEHRRLWAPADMMILGDRVDVKEDDGVWTTGWLVAQLTLGPHPKGRVLEWTSSRKWAPNYVYDPQMIRKSVLSDSAT